MPPRRLRAPVPSLLVAVLAGVLAGALLTGCGSQGAKEAAADAPAKPGTDVGLVHDYLAALATNDPKKMVRAADLAAPGSLALAYATYLRQAATAAAGAGEDRGPDTVKESQDGIDLCSAAQSCVRYSNVAVSDKGVQGFFVGGQNIESRLDVVGADGTDVALGSLGALRVLSRYKSPTNQGLLLVVAVAAGDHAIDLVLEDASYRAPDGTTFQPALTWGPKSVHAEHGAVVLLAYGDAAPGGTLAFTATDADGTEATASLPVA